jgi:hypothetical protein
MAIKRCPYCKAIIEEESGFCSNCGTRLLFPEDESKEEEIPGDKIVEEKETAPEEPEEVETDEERSKEEEKEEMELKEGGEEQAAISEEKEKKDSEKFLETAKSQRAEKVEEESEPKAEAQPRSGTMEFKTEELDQIPDARTKEREDIEKFLISLKGGERKAPFPEEQAPSSPQETGKEAAESLSEKTAAETPGEVDTDERLFIRKEIEEGLKTGFEAEETEEVSRPEEDEKEAIERFLASVKRERAGKAGILEEEEILPDSKKISEGTSKLKEELPPWAEKVQKGAPLEVGTEEREAAPELGKELQEEEVELEPEEKEEEGEEVLEEVPVPEKEVELKERMEEVGLPFEGEIEAERAGKKRAPSTLSIWLKRRAFDLLSMAVLWIISLWLASRLMKVSLFKLISVSALPSLGFYLVLLVIYFSFFILMLGETPGDLIFSREE